jgi:hypothetical protein
VASEDPFLAVEFDDVPTADLMPAPIFWLREGEEEAMWLERIGAVEPPIYAAWFAAINYISYRWTRDGIAARIDRPSARHQRQEWAEELSNALVSRLGLTIFRLRQEVLQASRNSGREDQIAALEEQWLQLGRKVGVIPSVKGGPDCTLSNDFLRRLVEEAKALVTECQDYTWEPEHEDHVTSLRIGEESDLLDESFQALVEEQMKRDPAGAQARMMRRLRKRQAELDIKSWMRVLRFPMLGLEEIRALASTARTAPRTIALDLTSGRLPIRGPAVSCWAWGARSCTAAV